MQESAISRRIRDLEDELGAALFIRHSGGVILTQAGNVFVRHARRVLSQMSHASIDVGSFGRGEAGVIRIGIFSSLASGFLAHLMCSFNTSHVDVRVEIVEGAPSEHLVAVQHHQLTWRSSLAFNRLIGAIPNNFGPSGSLLSCQRPTRCPSEKF